MFRRYLSFPQNVYLLFFIQIIGGVSATILTLLGGFIGAAIAPTPTLATLPATIMIVGIASGTIPSALLMRKVGRKYGFLSASILAFCASILSAFAVSQDNFVLFCISAFFLGFYGAFVQQYRFAAAESVHKHIAPQAVGFVLFAGILSGVIGPEIAKLSKDLFSLHEFTAPFIILSGLFILSIVLILFMRNTRTHIEEEHLKTEQPLKSIIIKPHFYIAVLAAATAYGFMTFIGTALPIHLHTLSHYGLDSIVIITQSHVVAMYLPSLFTGALVQKFGVYRILLTGLLIYFLAILFGAIAQNHIWFYWTGFVLIGIGWNFLYISSTMLLAQSHSHTERFKAQGLNDFIVVLFQILASFLAGVTLFTGGFVYLNIITIPLLFVVFLVFTFNRKKITQS